MKLLANECRVTGSDEGEVFTEGTRRYRRPISRDSGAQQIIQTVSRYGPGRAPVRINPVGEEVHYVASGRGACSISGQSYALEPGTAFYVPAGAPFFIENSGGEAVLTVSVCCPQDELSHLVAAGQIVNAPEGERLRRTVHERERRAIPTGDREFKLLIDRSFGCERVTQFIGFIPRSRAPYHHHPYEEAIYILEGRGVVWAGGESCEFAPGTSIYLPAGASHCLENPHPELVRLLGVFYPSGSPAVRYDDQEIA
jgi:mannose-6-phosphate isomerase-like protein (cupin superfamily)